jgi:hypothetical protein
MRIACHQPCYLPWPGFFCKARCVDVLVFLDSVQFPRGASWVPRNRIKTAQGQIWLTVPVRKRGRGLQRIMDVEVENERPWARDHLASLTHAHKKSPFFEDYIPLLSEVYEKKWDKLLDLNVAFLVCLMRAMGIGADIRFSSEFDLQSKGTALLVGICRAMKADTYATVSTSAIHLDGKQFTEEGIRIEYYNFRCPRYPQLWGDFIPNLSVVDLLFNCGPKSAAVVDTGHSRSSLPMS